MTKPTKGPWKIDTEEETGLINIIDNRGRRLFSDEYADVEQEECLANVTLAVAAPEMLEDLVFVIEALEKDVQLKLAGAEYTLRRFRSLKDTIAKAKGGGS